MDRLMAIGPKSREFDDHIIAIVFFFNEWRILRVIDTALTAPKLSDEEWASN